MSREDDTTAPMWVIGKVGILLADDRADDLRVLATVLDAPGHDLVCATSGSEALRHLLERDFAVIVLDVVMPGMDGFELAALIRGRKRSAQTPILFLTGVGSDPAALHRAYALGAVDYLTKPVDADILRAKVAVFVKLFEKDLRIQHQSKALLEAARRNRELELEQVKLAGLRRMRSLADEIPLVVWTAELDGTVTYFNRRWFDFTGATSDSTLARSWLAAVHEDDLAPCQLKWEAALAEATPFETICRLRAADGGHRWHLCRVTPERDGEERPVGWLGTFTDLDDMLRAHRKAERAIQIRDEFLSIASHELRTPLSALLVQLGSLERTLREVSTEPREQVEKSGRKVAAALRHTSRLTKLVDNLLDISRLSNAGLALALEELDLAELVRDVVERFADEARQAGSELVVRTEGQAQGRWDRLRLEQVVTNLLSNALKYGRGRPIEVVVAVAPLEASIRVCDLGIGIAPEDHARIFDRFERAVPVQHYGGLGLGLYITRTIVEAHGGAIAVESQLGAGATFVVRLPLGSEVSAEPAVTGARAFAQEEAR